VLPIYTMPYVRVHLGHSRTVITQTRNAERESKTQHLLMWRKYQQLHEMDEHIQTRLKTELFLHLC